MAILKRGQRRSGPPATRGRLPRRRGARRPDAIGLLREDHERVLAFFDQFERARGGDRKQKLVRQICDELAIHAQLEEEVFYPAVRQAIKDDDLMNEAKVEHQTAKDLIGQLQGMSADDDLFDAKTTVLGEYIRHHVREEQGEMFPQARRASLDLVALGDQLRARKEELTSGIIGRFERMLS